MIENNTSANPTLTFDQLQAIDVAQKTLANLQSEITNATKILKGTKLESDRAVKEKLYQEELLANATKQAEAKTKELNDLITNHTDTSAKLASLNSEIETKTAQHSTKTAELNERETKIAEKEKQLAENSNELSKKQSEHYEYVKNHSAKVAKLKEVIALF